MNEELLKRLDILADKLGTTANHLWSVLIRQARLEGFTDLFIVLGTLVGVWYLVKWGRWVVKDSIDEAIWFVIGMIGLIALAILLMYTQAVITELGNPEYFALQKILATLKK